MRKLKKNRLVKVSSSLLFSKIKLSVPDNLNQILVRIQEKKIAFLNVESPELLHQLVLIRSQSTVRNLVIKIQRWHRRIKLMNDLLVDYIGSEHL